LVELKNSASNTKALLRAFVLYLDKVYFIC